MPKFAIIVLFVTFDKYDHYFSATYLTCDYCFNQGTLIQLEP